MGEKIAGRRSLREDLEMFARSADELAGFGLASAEVNLGSLRQDFVKTHLKAAVGTHYLAFA
jgi:hypothetical protein